MNDVRPYPHPLRMAEDLCREILDDWIHDSAYEFVVHRLEVDGINDLSQDEIMDIVNRVETYAHQATVVI